MNTNPEEINAEFDDSDMENLSLEEIQKLLKQDYSGELLEEEDAEQQAGTQETAADYAAFEKVLNNLQVRYETGTGYVYSFPDGSRIALSVPDGAVSEGPVRVKNDTGYMMVQIFKDDMPVRGLEGGELIVEPGEYKVQLSAIGVNNVHQSVTTYKAELSFEIRGELVNDPTISAPQNFVVLSVTKDGKPLVIEQGQKSMTLSESGSYNVVYAGKNDSSVRYTEQFTLDADPPELSFSEPVEDGPVFAPLFITCDDPEAQLTSIKNGIEVPVTENGLMTGGNYIIRAVDRAGNTTEVRVQVEYRQRHFSPVWGVFFAVLLFGLIYKFRQLRNSRQVR